MFHRSFAISSPLSCFKSFNALQCLKAGPTVCWTSHVRNMSILKNEEIKHPTVRLVQICPETKKKSWNIVSRSEALQLAKRQGLDLVLVSADSTPPVCKLENFSLIVLEQEKKDKVQRANKRANIVKEMLLTLGIDPHDFQTKMDRVKDFIEAGHQVKITVVLFKRGFRKVQQHAARVGANSKGAPIIEINEMTRQLLAVADNLSANVRQNDLFVEKLVPSTGENAGEPPQMSDVLNKREFLFSPKSTAPASHNKKK